MGWIDKKVPQKPTHECQKPDSGKGQYFEPGSIWECDDCGSRWEFREYYEPWGDYAAWDTWEEVEHPFTGRRQDGPFPGPEVTCVVCGTVKKEHEVDRTGERD